MSLATSSSNKEPHAGEGHSNRGTNTEHFGKWLVFKRANSCRILRRTVQSKHGCIRQVLAANEAGVCQSTALVSQCKHSCIRQILAVTKVGVRQSAALVGQCKHGCIRQVPAATKAGTAFSFAFFFLLCWLIICVGIGRPTTTAPATTTATSPSMPPFMLLLPRLNTLVSPSSRSSSVSVGAGCRSSVA